MPGGGVALLRAIEPLGRLEGKSAGDEAPAPASCRALEAPIRQIAENAGVDGGGGQRGAEADGANKGFNAAPGEYVDLMEAGIIDPTKVTRRSAECRVDRQNILTTEAIVAEMPDKDGGGGDGRHAATWAG